MSKAKQESPKKSVPSKAKKPSPRSNRPAKATPKARSGPSKKTDAELAEWLKDKAAKLKSLTAVGHKLKLDFVENAREKGVILIEAQEQVAHIPGRFQVWVVQDAGIGYSTALLWIDVAKHYDEVKKRFANSNPLELTLGQVRDAIRDSRQAQGKGKPGSGRRKVESTAPPNDSDEDGVTDPADSQDGAEEAAPETQRWENAAAAAEAEAAEVSGAEKNEPKPQHYKVVVTVANEGDQATIQAALSNWNPTSVMPIGTKQVRSVSVHVRPDAIGTAFERLGKALATNPPKTVKVSVEL